LTIGKFGANLKPMYRVNMFEATQQECHIPHELIRIETLMEAITKNPIAKRKMAMNVAKDIKSIIGKNYILYACDSAGISTKAYKALFDTSKQACNDLGIKENFLPNPY
jgi:hypothetical protein